MDFLALLIVISAVSWVAWMVVTARRAAKEHALEAARARLDAEWKAAQTERRAAEAAEAARKAAAEAARKAAAEAARKVAEEDARRRAEEEEERREAAEVARLEAEALASAEAKVSGLVATAEALKNAAGGEYFTASAMKEFEAAHGASLEIGFTELEWRVVHPVLQEALEDAASVLTDRDAFRTHYNRQFVQRRLETEAAWFDARATRLTHAQRTAVVTDEDATLVVAAAGSGKTATIVAKAEYLVRRGLAKAHEICLLAFNAKAAKEIGERLRAVGVDGARVSTFHALGLATLGDARGSRPAVSPLADDPVLHELVNRQFRQLFAQEEYRNAIRTWLLELRVTLKVLDEAPTADERLRKENSLGLRSLKGPRMRSQAELKVADWLTLHGIDWSYESTYPNAPAEAKRRLYQPDFRLGDSGVWLEVWALSRDGKAAPNINPQKYAEGMAWKRELHAKHGTRLIEVWQDEIWGRGLGRYLEDALEHVGFKPRPIDEAEWMALMDDLRNTRVTELTKLVATFLRLQRGGMWSTADLTARARDERDQTFLELYLPIFRAYMAELESTGAIDFDAMLTGAIEALPTVPQHRFRYILVDEFQDTSRSRLEFIRALRAASPGTRLVLVGDDWQSINRFAGSDVAIFTEAPKHLGPTELVTLGTTFRLRPDVTGISSRFVARNPAQHPKEVNTARGELGEAGVVLLGHPEDGGLEALGAAFDMIRARSGEGSSVLVLSRYNKPLEDTAVRALCEAEVRRGLTVQRATIHASKGAEADHVVVLGLKSDLTGFPNLMSDDPVLQLVSVAPDPFPSAEERRLMYVALTRSRGRVYLLYPEDAASVFVMELLQREEPLLEVFGKITERLPCPMCQGRTILRRDNERGAFWTCLHFPRCDGRLEGCEHCKEGALVHLSPSEAECSACRVRVRRCPRCRDGLLRERRSRTSGSVFLGCTSWRSDGEGCTYTRNL